MRGLRGRPRRRALGAAARAAPRQLADRARRAARVPHPRRDQGRAGPDRAPDRRVRRPERVRRAVLRDGAHRRVGRSCSHVPEAGRPPPRSHGRALEELIDALVAIHAVDWRACGLGDLAHDGDYLPRQITRWLAQLDSYGGRDLPAAHRDRGVARRAPARRISRARCATATTSSTTCSSRPSRRRACSPSSTGRWPAIGDPLVDLAWALIFHPGPEGTMRLGMAKEPTFAVEHPARSAPSSSSATRGRSGRDTTRASAGTTCSRAGSSRSCSKAATPSSCAASPTSRSTSSSGRRSTCCSRARRTSSTRSHVMSETGGTTMRAWQVQGAGEPRRRAAPGRGRGARARARVRSASASTAAGIGLPDVLMCRGTYPLTPAAAVHARPGGDRRGHRGRRGRRPARSAAASCA